MPTIYIFSGLPGVGKTTLAKLLAIRLQAVYLRIDTIEQALRDMCQLEAEYQGYQIAHRIAADNLHLGNDVVADSCNAVDLTRRDWEQLASESGAAFSNVEIICGDQEEHRRRVESRKSTVPGLRLPTWQEVAEREYHPWIAPRIVINTAGRTEVQSLEEMLSAIGANLSC